MQFVSACGAKVTKANQRMGQNLREPLLNQKKERERELSLLFTIDPRSGQNYNKNGSKTHFAVTKAYNSEQC